MYNRSYPQDTAKLRQAIQPWQVRSEARETRGEGIGCWKGVILPTWPNGLERWELILQVGWMMWMVIFYSKLGIISKKPGKH